MPPALATIAGSPKRSRSVGRQRKPRAERDYQARFAQRLCDLLKNRDMSAQELADKLHVSPQTVWDWLAGRSVPKLNSWPAIAKALGAKDPNELLPGFTSK